MRLSIAMLRIGIWTLTRRIEDDASASPYQGEAMRAAREILRFALDDGLGERCSLWSG
jgi:hypothetical protein